MKTGTPWRPQQISNYEVLHKYEWVNGFLQRDELNLKRQALISEVKEIRKANVTQKEFLKAMEASYQALEQRRHEYIVDFLRRHQRRDDPLEFWEHGISDPLNHNIPLLPTLDEFQRAAGELEYGSLSYDKKIKKIKNIESEIREIDERTAAAQREGKTGIAKTFIARWREVQSMIREPVGPRGIALEFSSEAEKEAWNSLGLIEYLNQKAAYVAAGDTVDPGF